MRAILHSSKTGRVQTSAAGATPVNLGDMGATEVLVINSSGTSIDLKTANSDVFIPIADGASILIGVAANISEVAVKRTDESATQVYVHFLSSRSYVG